MESQVKSSPLSLSFQHGPTIMSRRSMVAQSATALFCSGSGRGAFGLESHKLLPVQQTADKRGKPQAEREREAQRAQCGGGAEQTDRHLMHRADVHDDLAHEPQPCADTRGRPEIAPALQGAPDADAGGEQEQIQNDPSGDAAGHKDPHHFQKRKRFHTIPPVE